MKRTVIMAVTLALSIVALPVTAAITRTDPMVRTQAKKLQTAGLTGKSIRVGVISNGMNGVKALVTAGALPEGIIAATNVNTIPEANPKGTGGEGTAMMQIIHQMAPGAQLVFCSRWTGIRFATGPSCYETLIDKYQADIVVNDIGSDGVFYRPLSALHLKRLLNKRSNALVINAVGNHEKLALIAKITPKTLTSAVIDGTRYERVIDFGTLTGHKSTPYETIELQIKPADTDGQSLNQLTYHAYWKADVEVATNDIRPGVQEAWQDQSTRSDHNRIFRVWILADDGTVLKTESNDKKEARITNHANPVYANTTGHKQTVRVVVALTKGQVDTPRPLWVKVESIAGAVLDMPLPGLTDVVNSLPRVISVEESHLDGYVSASSKAGPFYLYWRGYNLHKDSEQARWEASYTERPKMQQLKKPDLTGVGCWQITPNEHFSNGGDTFCGTSSAAPSVAGIAALLMEAGMTRDEIVNALERTAKHLTTDQYKEPITASQGVWDQYDGYGLIQGYDALKAAGPPLPAPAIDNASSDQRINVGESLTLQGDCTISSGAIQHYSWDLGNGTTASTQAPDVTFSKPGTYDIRFNCTSDKGVASGEPATTTVVVARRPENRDDNGGSGSSGGGGAANVLSLLWLTLLGIGAGRLQGKQRGR